MATLTETRKSNKLFTGLSCPKCGEPSDEVDLALNLHNAKITCSGCDEEFTAREAVARLMAQVGRWEALAKWVEMAGAWA